MHVELDVERSTSVVDVAPACEAFDLAPLLLGPTRLPPTRRAMALPLLAFAMVPCFKENDMGCMHIIWSMEAGFPETTDGDSPMH